MARAEEETLIRCKINGKVALNKDKLTRGGTVDVVTVSTMMAVSGTIVFFMIDFSSLVYNRLAKIGRLLFVF